MLNQQNELQTLLQKEIKIDEKNATKIEEFLNEINGKAESHTFSRFSDIKYLADSAEKRLEEILGGKVHFTGTKVEATSGEALPMAYKYKRITTSIILTRKSSGWYLTHANSVCRSRDGGKVQLVLSDKQKYIAASRFLNNSSQL
jgi:hypothetical protein